MNKLFVLLVMAGCGGAAQPATSTVTSAPTTEAPRAAFEPTSFGVEVSGTGRPVIFIPGLGCPGSIWKDTVAHLGGNVQAHVLTLSGFAGRPPIDKPLVATVHSELASYIRDRHLDHPVVIGHSLGGFLTYWIAATDADIVGPVVVVDAAVSFGAMPGGLAQAAKMRDGWKQMPPQEFAAAIRQFFGAMTNQPAKIDPLLTEILRSDQRAMADAFYELFTTDIRADLPKITAPLLAIVADTPYQQFIAGDLASVPHHEVVAIPHTKHMVMYDDPAAFNRALDAFLAAHPR